MKTGAAGLERGQKLDTMQEICYSYLNHTENTIL